MGAPAQNLCRRPTPDLILKTARATGPPFLLHALIYRVTLEFEVFFRESGVCTDHVFWEAEPSESKKPPHILGGKLL
jgi:hypothetical protein